MMDWNFVSMNLDDANHHQLFHSEAQRFGTAAVRNVQHVKEEALNVHQMSLAMKKTCC
jgi:hypothetical protein